MEPPVQLATVTTLWNVPDTAVQSQSDVPPIEGTCATYVGETITTKPFDAVIAALPEYQPKGEYETTEQYNARLAGPASVHPSAVIIAKTAWDRGPCEAFDETEFRDSLVYDADTQTLGIGVGIFKGPEFDALSAFAFAKGPTPKTGVFNIGVIVSESESTTGDYVASNAFGVKADVRRVTHTAVRHSPPEGVHTSVASVLLRAAVRDPAGNSGDDSVTGDSVSPCRSDREGLAPRGRQASQACREMMKPKRGKSVITFCFWPLCRRIPGHLF
ncbi:MAG TPA: hypothetical protein VGK20_03490 [Candidatus Binatia bacterium]|jgi:hypothetical protein